MWRKCFQLILPKKNKLILKNKLKCASQNLLQTLYLDDDSTCRVSFHQKLLFGSYSNSWWFHIVGLPKARHHEGTKCNFLWCISTATGKKAESTSLQQEKPKKTKTSNFGPKKNLVLFIGGGQNHRSKARLLGFKNIPKNPNLETDLNGFTKDETMVSPRILESAILRTWSRWRNTLTSNFPTHKVKIPGKPSGRGPILHKILNLHCRSGCYQPCKASKPCHRLKVCGTNCQQLWNQSRIRCPKRWQK